MSKMATGSVALIYTNARRGMSCGVVPSRHIVLGSPIRALRTRLPSLRSVLPSRQIATLCSACQVHHPRLLLSNVVPVVVKNDMPLPPSLDSWKLVRPTRSPLNCKAKNSCRFVKFVGKIFFKNSCKRAQLALLKTYLLGLLYSITQSERVRVAVSKLMPTFTMGRPHCEKRAG